RRVKKGRLRLPCLLPGFFEDLHDLGRDELVRRNESLYFQGVLETLFGVAAEVLVGTTLQVETSELGHTPVEVTETGFLGTSQAVVLETLFGRGVVAAVEVFQRLGQELVLFGSGLRGPLLLREALQDARGLVIPQILRQDIIQEAAGSLEIVPADRPL